MYGDIAPSINTHYIKVYWEVTNKGTAIAYNDLHLLRLHSLACGAAVFTTHDTVLCMFNCIFTDCELVFTSCV